jgi:mannose-6-phosphate isomerase-like protein (cupin superfamily)
MHHVSKVDLATAVTPQLYERHSTGFRRSNYVQYGMGSVHMGVGICYLESGGLIESHLHAFEESFYILEGSVESWMGERNYAVGPGHFGLIPTGVRHGWRNTSSRPVRWLEMQAPQPRPAPGPPDTFFTSGEVPGHATVPPEGPDAAKLLVGHFDEAALLPRPGAPSQMEGFNPTTGVAIKMFVDRSFGAIHQSLFLIQYAPGAKIDLHDHTFEESYFIVGGRVRAVADGKTYDLGPGEVIWTSVGCIHSFENAGNEPVRWIETQAPLPPAKEIFRFERDWTQFR